MRERDPLELRREVWLVPQLPALLEGTVEDNIRFAAGLAGREPDVTRLLDLAGLDASFAGRDVGQALGGRAAAGDARPGAGAGARVLLLDEPTSALDEAARERGRGDAPELRRASQGLDRARHPRPRPGPPDGRLGGAARRGRLVVQGPAKEQLAV